MRRQLTSVSSIPRSLNLCEYCFASRRFFKLGVTASHLRSTVSAIHVANARGYTMPTKAASGDFNKGYSEALAASSRSKSKPAPQPPRPSSSVLLVSPTNEVLLLHRVRTSSSFPSAHVFPGGNVSGLHDGQVPPPEDPKRHEDSIVYQHAAVRETFEESGILLAKDKNGGLLAVEETEREKGRKDVHSGKIKFTDWLDSKGGVPDTGIALLLVQRQFKFLICPRFLNSFYSMGYATKCA